MYTKEELQSVNSMNKATLRAACSAAKIMGYSKMNVAQMRTAVQWHMEREMAAAVKKTACTCTITEHERQENKNCPVHFPPAKAVVMTTGKLVIGARCESQNGVRKPIRGVCADVWSWLNDHRDAESAAVRAWAEKKGLNVSNALQERSAFRRFHGITSEAAQAA